MTLSTSKLPELDPAELVLCKALIALYVLAPYAWGLAAGPGLAGLGKIISFAAVPTIAIAYLCKRSSQLGDFIQTSMFIDRKAWAGAFILAVLALFSGSFGRMLWREFVGFPPPVYSYTADAIAATRPLSLYEAGRVFLIIHFSLLTPCIEEIIFKVLTLICLPRKTPALAYVLLSSTLFSMAHLNQGIELAITVFLLLGLPSAYYFQKSRNLGAIVVYHGTYNLWAAFNIFIK